MTELYRPLYLNHAPLVFTGRRTAELIKYAANAFLATKITFINEMADLCEQVGADVQEVARGIGLDNRIGSQIPACRARLRRLVLSQGHAGADQDGAGLRRARCASSRRWPRSTISASAPWRARSSPRCGGSVRGKTIAVLGLTFKPNTDDMRDAPSIAIITALQDAGAHGARLRSGRHGAGAGGADRRRAIATDAYRCAEGADALVIVTEWEQFRALDLRRGSSAVMAEPVLVDLRNIYRPEEMALHGFSYDSVGRGQGVGL